MNINIEKKIHTNKQLKNFQKKIRVGLTLCLFIKKEAQTRVSRIGNGVHYNDYRYKYSNVNCNDVKDNIYTKLKCNINWQY